MYAYARIDLKRMAQRLTKTTRKRKGIQRHVHHKKKEDDHHSYLFEAQTNQFQWIGIINRL